MEIPANLEGSVSQVGATQEGIVLEDMEAMMEEDGNIKTQVLKNNTYKHISTRQKIVACTFLCKDARPPPAQDGDEDIGDVLKELDEVDGGGSAMPIEEYSHQNKKCYCTKNVTNIFL